MTDPQQRAKCRVNWNKPIRAGTICNYVDEVTNECRQSDWKRCPCGGIVRYPRFDELPWRESDRSYPAPSPEPNDRFVMHLLKIKLEHDKVKRELEEYEIKSKRDEMTSEDWEDVDQLKGWDEALGWALIPTDDLLKQHDAAIRNQTLDALFQKVDQRQMDVETEEDTVIEVIEKGEVLAWIDELRTEEQP